VDVFREATPEALEPAKDTATSGGEPGLFEIPESRFHDVQASVEEEEWIRPGGLGQVEDGRTEARLIRDQEMPGGYAQGQAHVVSTAMVTPSVLLSASM
jgi:hypothetical protein